MTDTVVATFEHAVAAWPTYPAYTHRQGSAWRTTTWKEYGERAHRIARGFLALGLDPGKGVAIIGSDRPEWFLSDVGAILAGGVPVGIYATSSPEQCAYIIGHSDSQVAVVEDADQLAKVQRVWGELPGLRAVVLMDGSDPDDRVLSYAELEAAAERVPAGELERRKAAQGPDDVCTLVYTSGTTGPPKGVMTTHRNIVWTARAAVERLAATEPGDSAVCYLPLSHIAEQMVSLFSPMLFGGCTYFEPDLDRLGETLREARPAYFLGVPRVWEKVQGRIMAAGASSGPVKRRIAAWARGVGLAAGLAEQRGEPRPRLYPLADRLVFSKVKRTLGLDRCKIAISSTAPISRDTLEFFLSLGVVICEIYGMTECTAPATVSTPAQYRTGKAGYAIPGSELRIASDGEILIRGPHVFKGYFKNEAATAETLDAEGWLYSGDIGTLDEEGFLQVTDRKKELIITAGGKNVAPAVVENVLKSVPVIAQAVVIGDRRKFLSALVTLDPERIAEEARVAGVEGVADPASAAASPAFGAHLLGLVEQASAVLSRVETVRRVTILPGELTEAGGELTPTMKLKRRVINEKYAAQIEAMYA